MKLVPQQWTHQHTHRLFHGSMLVVFIFVMVVAVSGIFLNFLVAQGGTVTYQQGEATSVTVPEINAGPSAVNYFAAGPGITTQDPAAQPASPTGQQANSQQPAVVINRAKFSNYNAQHEAIFNSQFPEIVGQTNIPNAIVTVDSTGNPVIHSNLYADAAGNWTWKSIEPLAPGSHTLTFSARDPNAPAIAGVSVVNIYIQVNGNVPILQPKPLNVGKRVVPTKNIFDVIVKIPSKFKTLAPGDELIAEIKLINFSKENNLEDVQVEYIISNASGNTVSYTSETVAVATQLSILKSFYTSATLAKGRYTLTVRAPSKNLVASSADTFDIAGAAILDISPRIKADYSIVFQGLLALSFFFGIVIYFEYNKVKLLSQVIKKVDAKDLKQFVK